MLHRRGADEVEGGGAEGRQPCPKTTAALGKQLPRPPLPAFVPPLCKFGAPGPVPYLSDPEDDPDLSDPDAPQDTSGVDHGDGDGAEHPEEFAGGTGGAEDGSDDGLTIPRPPAADDEDDQIEGGAPV